MFLDCGSKQEDSVKIHTNLKIAYKKGIEPVKQWSCTREEHLLL